LKKKSTPKRQGFDEQFDEGQAEIDFSKGMRTDGLSKVVKLPPITIPVWLAAEIESLSQIQANSKASVIRQLLVEAIEAKKKSA